MASVAMPGSTEEGSSEVNLDSHTSDMANGEDCRAASKRRHRASRKGSSADTGYEQLLGRVFRSLGENHPGLAERRGQPIFMPPNVLREAPDKRVFVNFMDTCERMRRQPKDVMNFLLSEMRTSGSLDEQQRLVVKGKFKQRDFGGPLRRYTNEYVICNACKLPDTTLSREERLLFLRCEQCGFSKSVAPIKARVFPQVDRRRA